MALDGDDEILQDFLVEASEILELLNEQLVDLEQRPTDTALLNAIFRGFHTIKGGAGFLSLSALVNVCHRSEDVFNLLRNNEKRLTSNMMDNFLRVLDVLNEQFANLRQLREPEPAPPDLLRALEAMNHPGNADEDDLPAAADEEPQEPTPVATVAEGDITDDEFEALLDALDAPETAVNLEQESGGGAALEEDDLFGESSPPSTDDSDISEEEFEALLDKIHGKGKFGSVETAEVTGDHTTTASTSNSDEITEAEFEALLDQIHGKGKFSAPSAAEITAATPPQASSPPKAKAPATPPPSTPRTEPAKTPPVAAAKAAPPPPPPSAPVDEDEAGKRDGAKKGGENAQAESSVRVDTKRLDDIMNMVGELVLVRNRLSVLANGDAKDIEERLEDIQKAVSNLDVVTGDLQASVMKTRMQPIKKVFGRFPRVVRDLARSLKKDVNLELFGEDTDLDKNLVEALADPLVHLVRNAVDHGVEMPEVRENAGKSRQGRVRLSAEQEGDHILLKIEDDGAGMDPVKLRSIAVIKGLMDEESAARLSDKETFMLIFAPGFSTKTEISDISGRGVGMDVVKTRIAQLNGSVEIDSVLGKGSVITIKVPLTLAIMPTLIIKLAEQAFALPLVSVNEIFHLDLTKTNVVDGQRVVMIRQKALPLYYLSSWLVKDKVRTLPSKGHVVVVHVGTQLVGFVVDHLIGQEEVVIKPLGALLHGTQGMAGATITGDGNIALILDIPGLMKAYS